jgi:uncharacterized protein HemX
LTTREKGAGIGALGGAAVGRLGAGAAIGGALGLGSGALVGDQLQGQEQKQSEQQRQIDATRPSWSGRDATWKGSKKPGNTNPESTNQRQIEKGYDEQFS